MCDDEYRAQVKPTQRVLVVDDNESLRRTTSRLIENMGIAVDTALDGLDALAKMETQEYSLVISDIQMPGMNGQELLAAVTEKYPDMGMIMMSGLVEVERAVDCLAAGALDYITKPFGVTEVQTRIKRALERHALLAERKHYQVELERRVRAQAERLQMNFFEGAASLVEALEAKDSYTRGHSERVGILAGKIARGLGWDEEKCVELKVAGQLHDIGKIGVRDDILGKPGKLTTEEYAHIMTHMMTGWRILQSSCLEHPLILNVVRWHHERLDGKGLPDALAEADIPMEARIISVADAFDSMTSDRSYRPKRPISEAVAELERVAGTQVENRLVGLLKEIIQREGANWSVNLVTKS